MAAFEDEAGRGDDRIGALAARQTRLFDDSVKRNFGGAPEDREDRFVAAMIDGVVAPFAIGDLAAVDLEDFVELLAIEGDRSRRRAGLWRGGKGDQGPSAAARLYVFAVAHGSSCLWSTRHDRPVP